MSEFTEKNKKAMIVPMYNENTQKWSVTVKHDDIVYCHSTGDIIEILSAFSHVYLHYPYTLAKSNGLKENVIVCISKNYYI